MRVLFALNILFIQFIFAQDSDLEDRIPNISFLIDSESTTLDVGLQHVFTKLNFNRPVLITHSNDNSNRLFVVQQNGTIYVFPNDSNVIEGTEFLRITNGLNDTPNEAGLLGLAFHPDYKNNGKFYVNYTANNLITRISEFVVSNDSNKADANSERILLEVNQPYENHNGGMLAFGSEGYLYVGLGDGGDAGDPQGHAQNTTTLLGSILRIDVDNKDTGLEYAIPADNPFISSGTAARIEIWAFGLRNPWRFSFDRLNNTLWAGDVGQYKWEEIDIIEKGKNYGWKIMEGLHCFNSNYCDTTGLTLPIIDYNHNVGCSVTGGYVYRGSDLPDLYGTYIYGDYCYSTVWGLKYQNGQVLKNESITQCPGTITSFGEDEQGELYIVSGNGKIYKFSIKNNSGINWIWFIFIIYQTIF